MLEAAGAIRQEQWCQIHTEQPNVKNATKDLEKFLYLYSSVHVNLYSCGHATLHESNGRSISPSVPEDQVEKCKKREFLIQQLRSSVCGRWVRVWAGVVPLCPPVRNDFVTPCQCCTLFLMLQSPRQKNFGFNEFKRLIDQNEVLTSESTDSRHQYYSSMLIHHNFRWISIW